MNNKPCTLNGPKCILRVKEPALASSTASTPIQPSHYAAIIVPEKKPTT